MTNRDFPKNTCPASRHVEMMAEILATGARYYMFEDEPEHCAESMRAVVEELWRLRTLAAQQDGVREARPDREGINAVLVDLIGDGPTPSLLVRSDRMRIADAILAHLNGAEQEQEN